MKRVDNDKYYMIIGDNPFNILLIKSDKITDKIIYKKTIEQVFNELIESYEKERGA